MVTGDNVRTAISVARECGMIQHHDHVYIPSFASGHEGLSDAELEWTHIDDSRLRLNPYSLRPLPAISDSASLLSLDLEARVYHLAITGDVFRWMIDYGSSETLQKVSSVDEFQKCH